MKYKIAHSNRMLSIKNLYYCLPLIALLTSSGIALADAELPTSSFYTDPFNISPGLPDTDEVNSDVAFNPILNQWLVVWEDERSGTDTGIYARRVGMDGSLAGDEIVLKDSDDILRDPRVAFDNEAQRYLVVWTNWSQNYIEGKMLYATGGNYTSVFTVQTCGGGCGDPDVAYNPVADEFLVVWDVITSTTGDIKGRRVSNIGTPQSTQYFIAGDADTNQYWPAIAADTTSGKYLVVYSSDEVGSDYDIRARRLSSNGSTEGSEFNVFVLAGDDRYPHLAINPGNGSAFIAWTHDLNPEGVNIYGKIVTSGGGVGLVRNVGSNGFNNVWPSVTFNPYDNLFLVVWAISGAEDIYGRWMRSDGGFLLPEFQITGDESQWRPDVMFGPNRFLVAYNNTVEVTMAPDNTDVAYNTDIFGRIGARPPFLFLPIVNK